MPMLSVIPTLNGGSLPDSVACLAWLAFGRDHQWFGCSLDARANQDFVYQRYRKRTGSVAAFWRSDMQRIGGISKLATLINQERAVDQPTVLFDAGDIFTGALSKRTGGRLAVDLYGLMGYDAITLGNHEFEYGWQALLRVLPRAKYPVLNANIFYEGGAPLRVPMH